MDLKIVPAYSKQQEIIKLFSEYTDMLIDGDSTFKDYLGLQNYDEELQHLNTKYGIPEGRLYLAYYDEAVAGCIGLKKLTDTDCEMKRLYVRPEFRGHQIGNNLIEQVIMDARDIGYKHMLLDTLPFLKSAIHIYKKYGFYETERYNDSPMDASIYMKLDL